MNIIGKSFLIENTFIIGLKLQSKMFDSNCTLSILVSFICSIDLQQNFKWNRFYSGEIRKNVTKCPIEIWPKTFSYDAHCAAQCALRISLFLAIRLLLNCNFLFVLSKGTEIWSKEPRQFDYSHQCWMVECQLATGLQTDQNFS